MSTADKLCRKGALGKTGTKKVQERGELRRLHRNAAALDRARCVLEELELLAVDAEVAVRDVFALKPSAAGYTHTLDLALDLVDDELLRPRILHLGFVACEEHRDAKL